MSGQKPPELATLLGAPSGPVPWISQTVKHRVVVPATFAGGSACTLIFVRDVGADHWLLYRQGVDEPPIRLSEADAAQIVAGLKASR
ncbi:MAG: hypothetical protein ACRDTC_23880 [Pseudonocardiaceae bacterium]